MNLLALPFLLLSVRRAAAELDSVMVSQTLGLRTHGKVVRRGGPLDMRLGMAIKASKFLEWERWFAPEIKTISKIGKNEAEKDTWSRIYIKDVAEKLCLIDIFPSTSGTFTASTGMNDSFQKPLKEDPMFSTHQLQFLAVLMAMGLGIRVDCQDVKENGIDILRIRHGQDIDFRIEKGRLERLARAVSFFRDGVECECSDPHSETFLLSKEVLLHGFMVSFFDSVDGVSEFYEHVYNLVGDDDGVSRLCFAEHKGRERPEDYVMPKRL